MKRREEEGIVRIGVDLTSFSGKTEKTNVQVDCLRK